MTQPTTPSTIYEITIELFGGDWLSKRIAVTPGVDFHHVAVAGLNFANAHRGRLIRIEKRTLPTI